MKPKTSAIWGYFVEINESTAKCQVCGKLYSRKGRTTTALKSHLKSLHATKFEEFEKLDKAKKQMEKNWQNESMSPSSSSQNVIILDDPKLDDFVKREDEELSSTPPPYLVPTTHRSEEMPSDALIEVDCGAPRKKQKVGELKQTDPLGCGCANVDKGCERASNYPAVPKEDSFDFFGKYIASTLRGVPLQTALELQRDMISLIMNKCK
uniref:BED-type domain-containing protein n=1 Tax=Photinus pyralis TaxID=7054 RepID=A0A1Y1K8A3_PHOPY